MAELKTDRNFLCVTPQRIDINRLAEKTIVFFRSREERGKTLVQVRAGNKEIFSKQYSQLRPPEMERITVSLDGAELKKGDVLHFTMEELQ
jgi:hypothetical protein